MSSRLIYGFHAIVANLAMTRTRSQSSSTPSQDARAKELKHADLQG